MAAVLKQENPATCVVTAKFDPAPRVALDGAAPADLQVALRRWGRLSGLTGFKNNNPHAIDLERLVR